MTDSEEQGEAKTIPLDRLSEMIGETDLTDEDLEAVDRVTDEKGNGSIITVRGLKVSASETVSTGDYESYEPFASMEADVILTGEWEEQKTHIQETLMDMEKTLQKGLEQACGNKIADDESWEDWSHPEQRQEEGQDGV